MKALSDYRISEVCGFILENPKTELPTKYQPWQEIIDNLWILLDEGKLREKVSELPVLDMDGLQSHEDLRLAHLQLSMICSSFVWQDGESGAAKVLPRAISVPLWNVSERLGTVPMLTHCDTILANTIRLVDSPAKRLESPSLEHLKLVCKFSAHKDWDVFFLTTSLLELAFARAIPYILQAATLSRADDGSIDDLVRQLQAIYTIIDDMRRILRLFHGNLDPDVFYQKLRPFLSGWARDSSVLPQGLVYDGAAVEPQYFFGSSAAQSLILQTCDVLLGIQHEKDKKQFLESMRMYMIKEHRDFLTDLEEFNNLRQSVLSRKDPTLTEVYNHLVNSIERFRSYHIAIVAKFIIAPSRRNANNFQSLKTLGTGGQKLMPFLKSIRESTSDQVIEK